MLGDVEDMEGVPQEQTEFRLAFYKTALKRPDWLRKLMTHFRTDEQILRLVIQVLLDPHQEADTWFLLDDRPSTPSGLSAASPSASDMDDGNAYAQSLARSLDLGRSRAAAGPTRWPFSRRPRACSASCARPAARATTPTHTRRHSPTSARATSTSTLSRTMRAVSSSSSSGGGGGGGAAVC
jgi:hypothetical protein